MSRKGEDRWSSYARRRDFLIVISSAGYGIEIEFVMKLKRHEEMFTLSKLSFIFAACFARPSRF